MLNENQIIPELFDEFYFITEQEFQMPVKRNEIPEQINDEFKFTGTNKRKTLFVHNDINQLSETEKIMLENLVVKAIGWKMDEFILLNLNDNSLKNFQEIKTHFQVEKIIFWGCESFLEQYHIPKKPYEVMRGKELTVLQVEPFNTYISNPDKKKDLWQAIRQLLDLK